MKIITALLTEGFFNFVSLEKKKRYTLGKEERLKSRKSIEHLFKEGNSFSIFPFRVLYLVMQDQPVLANDQLPGTIPKIKTGFTVGSRHFKKAVDRNRIRRLMREAWRLQKNSLQSEPAFSKNCLVLFFIYVGKELPEYPWIYEKTTAVLTRLIKLMRESR